MDERLYPSHQFAGHFAGRKSSCSKRLPMQTATRSAALSCAAFREDELISTALDAVHLERQDEEMEPVKARAQLLKSLEEKGLLVLYYDLKSYVKKDYQPYHDSDLFHLLRAAGGRRQPAGRLSV